MAKHITSSPKLRLHRPSGNGVVTFRDSMTGKRRDFYCGKWGSADSIEVYARLVRVWESSGHRLPDTSSTSTGGSDSTVGEVIVAYWTWASEYYAPGEVSAIRAAIRVVRDLYASTPPDAFTPRRLELVRDQMIAKGWSRKSINRQVSRVRQVFGFGVRQGLVPVDIHTALKSVPALRRGKSGARESKPVKPVPQCDIDATLKHLSAPVAALVRVQLLTGARSGELCIMRPCDVDRSGKVWAYRPTEHKTAHHDHERTIYIGPEAQKIIAPLLATRPPDGYLFSPLDAQGKAAVTARLTRYTPETYRTAIARACDAAFPPPSELARKRIVAEGRKRNRYETNAGWRTRIGPEGWKSLQAWRRDHRWHPHRLRHNAATRLRKEFGIELARIILGHRTIDVTASYAEADGAAAIQAMLKLG